MPKLFDMLTKTMEDVQFWEEQVDRLQHELVEAQETLNDKRVELERLRPLINGAGKKKSKREAAAAVAARAMPMKQRILLWLQEHPGPQEPRTMAESMGANLGSVRMTLQLMRRAGEAQKLKWNQWALTKPKKEGT